MTQKGSVDIAALAVHAGRIGELPIIDVASEA
jgi:hypothetical protein